MGRWRIRARVCSSNLFIQHVQSCHASLIIENILNFFCVRDDVCTLVYVRSDCRTSHFVPCDLLIFCFLKLFHIFSLNKLQKVSDTEFARHIMLAPGPNSCLLRARQGQPIIMKWIYIILLVGSDPWKDVFCMFF